MTHALDLLLVGATGFTGRLAARRLDATAPAGLRLGIAARNPARLAQLAGELDGRAEPVQLDLLDRGAVGRAVARAKVVASTAGPFALYGDALVDACVEHGSHYVDITGETAWVRRLIERHHARARTEGTRIVPFCGFDSVPADLGVLHLARHAHEELDDELVEVHSSYRLRGGLNGGTLATALHFAEHEDGRALYDPYLLAPEIQPSDEERRRQRDPRRPLQLPPDGAWAAPFVMGAINRRVVMRSHALGGQHAPPDREGHPRSLPGYGARFRYREFQRVRRGRRSAALTTTLALGGVDALLRRRLGRALLRKLGPAPGQGPSEATRAAGHTSARFHATTAGGAQLGLELEAAGDPGNAVTVRLLCEAALALCAPPAALELGAPGSGGVLTPALALGEHLLARLERTGEYSHALVEAPALA